MRMIQLIVALILLSLVTGCSTSAKKHGDNPALETYNLGKQSLAAGDFNSAIKHYRELEFYHSDTAYNRQAQLELAYAYLKTGDASSAVATAERFITTYPDHPNVDYAYYLRGLASFEQAVSKQDPKSFDIGQANPLHAQLSLEYFAALVEHFPDSKYSGDARQRMLFLQDKLAHNELMLARHLFDQGQFANAAVHSKFILENYPRSSAVADAVAVTNQSYKMMNLDKQVKAPNTVEPMAADVAASSETDTGMNVEIDAGIDTGIDTGIATGVATGVATVVEGAAATPMNTAPAAPETMPESMPATAMADPTMADPTMTAPMPAHETSPMIGDMVTPAMDSPTEQDWLSSRDPNHYTLQLIGSHDEAKVKKLINSSNLGDDLNYYRKTRNGTVWYVVVYGDFATLTAARTAINNLPEPLRGHQPWVRNYSSILADTGHTGSGDEPSH